MDNFIEYIYIYYMFAIIKRTNINNRSLAFTNDWRRKLSVQEGFSSISLCLLLRLIDKLILALILKASVSVESTKIVFSSFNIHGVGTDRCKTIHLPAFYDVLYIKFFTYFCSSLDYTMKQFFSSTPSTKIYFLVSWFYY